MSTNIEYTNIFISIMEYAEYDCGTAHDELQQLNLEYELSRLLVAIDNSNLVCYHA